MSVESWVVDGGRVAQAAEWATPNVEEVDWIERGRASRSEEARRPPRRGYLPQTLNMIWMDAPRRWTAPQCHTT